MSAAISASSTTENSSSISNSNSNNSNSNTLVGKNNSQSHFYPITKSVSVPDIHQNHPDDSIRSASNQNKCVRPSDLNNLLLTNSGSIESAIADSPAGSINEQFEANVNTPLSTDDAVDSIADTLRYFSSYCLKVNQR